MIVRVTDQQLSSNHQRCNPKSLVFRHVWKKHIYVMDRTEVLPTPSDAVDAIAAHMHRYPNHVAADETVVVPRLLFIYPQGPDPAMQ